MFGDVVDGTLKGRLDGVGRLFSTHDQPRSRAMGVKSQLTSSRPVPRLQLSQIALGDGDALLGLGIHADLANVDAGRAGEGRVPRTACLAIATSVASALISLNSP